MATDANIGFGVQFQRATNLVAPFGFVTIGEINAPAGYSPSKDAVEATHTASPNRWREFISGLRDGGEIEVGINFIPRSQDYQNALTDFASDLPRRYRIVFVTGETIEFDLIMTAPAVEVPLDDKMTATLTYKVTGEPVMTINTAPVVQVVPSISGVAQAGQILTARSGDWNVGGVTTWQWQELITATWTNIAGATASRLTVPGGATIGRSIRVQQTLTNSAGNATANSVGTVAVIA